MSRAAKAVLTGFSTRRICMIAVLVLGWCVLWGRFTVANALSGLAVGLIVTASGLSAPLAGGVRPAPLARLLWVVFVDLIRSTGAIGREILTPRDQTSESIVAVPVPAAARRHMLFYTAAITLTPGTVVVHADADIGVVYVHLLRGTGVKSTEDHVARLADLAVQAFPVPGTVEPRSSGSP